MLRETSYDAYEVDKGSNDSPDHPAGRGEFEFSSMYQKTFEPQMDQAAQAMEKKQMFTEIEVNVFVPRNPALLGDRFKILDAIDDDFESLERHKYLVSAQ